MLKGNARSVRAVPHVDGNFHTLCYIKVPISSSLAKLAILGLQTLESVVTIESQLQNKTDSCGSQGALPSDSDEELVEYTGTKAPWEYAHVSLCRPLYLKHQFIAPFLDKLNKALTRIKPFYLIFDDAIGICANENFTRYFAVAQLEKSCKDTRVLPLIDIVDEVVASFGYASYYTQRQPHASLASTAVDICKALQHLYKDMDGSLVPSHVWPRVNERLELCNKQDACTAESNGEKGVEYTISRKSIEEALNEQTSQDKGDKICIYIDKVHVLVGAVENEIQLF